MKTIKQILLTIAVLLFSLTANAYDFEVDGFYYNIISMEDLTVEVTRGDNSYSGEVIIPEIVVYGSKVLKVTSIEEETFSNCSSLTSVIIGNSVTSIEEETFSNCSSLASVIIGNSVTSIGKYAFYKCTSLTSIEIPNSVKSIGYGAFSLCFSLTNIVIGNSVTSIGEYAFSYCNNLTSIEIPNNVINIKKSAFKNCDSLKELRIEDGTETLSLGYDENYIYGEGYYNKGLFTECPLETLYLGRNLSHSIYYIPFEFNKTLTYVTIGNNVTNIGEDAFYGCSSLASVIIGNNVTNIGEDAFNGCSSLTSVIIGNSVTSIENHAFYKCTSLTSIEIPNSVKSIGYGAFEECSGLESIAIPNGVTNIEADTFYGCSGLKSIEIPNSVTQIFACAFYGCSELENIYIMAPIPPYVGGSNFTNNHFIHTILHVPYGSLATYQDDITWKNFWNIEEFYIDKYFYIRYFVDNVLFETDSIKHGSEIVLIDEPTKEGYTFSGWSEVPETMPAEDIEITGSFSVNTYKITYIVDGEIYATDSLTYGSEIVLIDEPTKEGHTFSGWSEAPKTMPAEDIEITGSFSVNSYTITYIVDGEVYATDELTYGSEIVLIDEPTKEGYTFSGWSEAPETMPAEDIEIIGSFSVNTYTITYIVDGEVYATDELAYGSEIVLIDEPVKEGYTFSGWSEVPETMPANDIEITGSFIPTENVSEVEMDVNIQTTNNGIILLNAYNNVVRVYTINGILVEKIDKYTGEEIVLNKGVYIVCVGDKAVKIKL